MNFIEQLVDRYDGHYSEDPIKKTYTPGGKHTFQPKRGIFLVEGTKITISYNDVGGAFRSTDPIRIVLHLDKNYHLDFSMYPSINLNRITNYFYHKGLEIPKRVRRQFSFRGNKELIKKVVLDGKFCENILNEEVYLVIEKRFPKSLMLTPAYGIYSLEQFDKLIFILKHIEARIKECSRSSLN